MLYRFADHDSLATWENSDDRLRWLDLGRDLVVESRVEKRTGIEGWFDVPQDAPASSAPPRWKQAVSIWLGFFPVNLAFTYLVGWLVPAFARARGLPRVLITTARAHADHDVLGAAVRDEADPSVAARAAAAGGPSRRRALADAPRGKGPSWPRASPSRRAACAAGPRSQRRRSRTSARASTVAPNAPETRARRVERGGRASAMRPNTSRSVAATGSSRYADVVPAAQREAPRGRVPPSPGGRERGRVIPARATASRAAPVSTRPSAATHGSDRVCAVHCATRGAGRAAPWS